MKTRTTLQVIGDNISTALTGTFREGVTELNSLGNTALISTLKKRADDTIRLRSLPDLDGKQKKAVKDYYAPFFRADTRYHRVYAGLSGRFYPDYMPDDLYFGWVERYFCDRDAATYLDNKCYYHLFFPNIPQPGLIAMRVNGMWLDGKDRLISQEELAAILSEEEHAVLKRAVNSEGGAGVFFFDNEDDGFSQRVIEKAGSLPHDLVIQRALAQHPDMEALHPGSVNTMRILSLLTPRGVRFIKYCVRIGVGDSRVDNSCSGGFFVGLDENGRTLALGCGDGGGRTYTSHPDLGYTLEGIQLPGMESARELIRKAHPVMACCGLISWDLAIDPSGNAVLIEPNLCLGDIFELQVCCGPLFGRNTKKILKKVFFDKKGRHRSFASRFRGSKGYHFIRDNFLAMVMNRYHPGTCRAAVLTDAALKRLSKSSLRELAEHFPPLTQEMKKSARRFYEPWQKGISTLEHRIFTGTSGEFHPDYLPEDMYLCRIDRYLNDRDSAYYLDNKCYAPRIFANVKQPETLAMRTGGVWLDEDYRIIGRQEAYGRVRYAGEAVFKAAQFSEGGDGVFFADLSAITDDAEAKELFDRYVKKAGRDDIIIQKAVRQHPSLSRIHPESLNTFRIVSLIIDGHVEILSRSFKFGIGSARVDNGCYGGMYVAMDALGTLGDVAVGENGMKILHGVTDSGYPFAGAHFDFAPKLDELAVSAHQRMPHFRLICWDVAVDEEGDALLIEGNLILGSTLHAQMVSGPFLGDFTGRILDEIYGRSRQ